jgi:hypothetical protein
MQKLASPDQEAALRPPIARTIPVPPTKPTRPIVSVSHGGIGSGPGSAKRASAPVMKAMKSAPITAPSMRGA